MRLTLRPAYDLKRREPILQEDKMMTKLALSLMLVFFLSPLSFAGDIWVYDANNQKLGILIGTSDDTIEIFLPSLNRPTEILIGSEEQTIPTRKLGKINEYWSTLYKDSSCTGPPGVPGEGNEIIYLFRPPDRKAFYGYARVDLTKLTKYGYYLDYSSGQCRAAYGGAVDGYPITVVPSDKIPFKTPVAFPLKFRYE
jgi:hypothetical protein